MAGDRRRPHLGLVRPDAGSATVLGHSLAEPAGAFDLGEFNGPALLTVFVIMVGFQRGWAPYVSEYSRYLPASIGVKAAFWWTYLPRAISGIWVFVLGAIMAAASPGADPVTGFLTAAVNFGESSTGTLATSDGRPPVRRLCGSKGPAS